MSVVYFTSNASTGSGSLVEAVKNAQPGDVIRPDATVFERGSIIEVVLASTLTVDKNLTLDASPFRVRLNGGGVRRCASVAANVTATFTGFDFVGGVAASSNGGGLNGVSTTNVTCVRCGFYGCSAVNGGGAYLTGVSELRDCVAVGCRATTSGGGVYVSKTSTINGSTVVGCVSSGAGPGVRVVNGTLDASNSILCGVAFPAGTTTRGCVVDVASSEVGFVASPPDDLTVDDWNANAWQDWDLRLFDDASGAPSPYRDSGDVDAMTQYDVQGNFRGRETNGVATCSPGAYETLQADLFWIGRDANGAEVVSPSFLTSDGWAASRFATVSGDVAPQAGQTLFIDGAGDFVDAAPQNATLNVGGRATVSIGSAATLQTETTLGFASTFTLGTSTTLRRFGDAARLAWKAGDLTVACDVAQPTLTVPPGATLAINGGSVYVAILTLADGANVAFSGADAALTATQSATVGSASFIGAGDLVFALGGSVAFDPAAAVNGVAISQYDAETNAVRITFEASELVWESRVSGANVEITDPLLDDDRFVFRFDRYANGAFVEFYATDERVSDASASAYETTSIWNGAASPTLVDANAEPGWNYYRVRLDEPVEKGGVLLNAYASPTRRLAVWVGNDEPTRTYYYRGGAKGSFIEPSDWGLTPDGFVPCVEPPTQAGATFRVVDA